MKLEIDNKYSQPLVNDYSIKTGSSQMSAEKISDLLRASIEFAKEGNRNDARHLLLRVTEAAPDNETAWLWLASISEYPEELLVFLQNVLKINPENERAIEWSKATKALLANTFVQRGINAFHSSQSDFAKQCFLQALLHHTENEMAWLWLASVTDPVEEKLLYLQKVLSINPENETALPLVQTFREQSAQTLLKKANSAVISGDYETAKVLLEDLMSGNPNFEEGLMLQAYMAEESEDKLAYYRRVLEINPENEAAQAALSALEASIQRAAQNRLEMAQKIAEMEQAEIARQEAAQKAAEEAAFAANTIQQEEVPVPYQLAAEEKASEDYLVEEAPVFASTNVEEFQRESSHEEYKAQPAQVFAYDEDRTAELPSLAFSEMNEDVDLQLEEPSEEESDVYELQEFEILSVENDDTKLEEAEIENTEDEFTLDADELEVSDKLDKEDEVSEKTYEFASEETFQAPAVSVEELPELERLPETQVEVVAEEKQEEATPETEKVYSFDNFSANKADEHTEIEEVHNFENFSTDEATEYKPEEVHNFDNFSANQEVAVSNDYVPDYAQPTVEFSYNGAEVSYVNEVENSTVEDKAESFDNVERFEPVTESYTPSVDFQEVYASYSTADENAAQTEEYQAEYKTEEYQADYKEEPTEMPVQEEIRLEEAQAKEPEMVSQSAAQPEVKDCPFCDTENEATAISCASCRSMLSLSDLEMILAYQDADQQVLSQAIERLEMEKSLREFTAKEVKYLGIAHLNAKNFRKALSYLQEVSGMTPNDVVLSSKVNFLAIRVSEIEAQENKNQETTQICRTIMVVDDSPTVRKLISNKLEKSGHTVIAAVDGVDALSKISEVIPDLVLLDITMPQLDGYQVCKMIRGKAETKDVPVVMISGKDGFFDKVRGKMVGTTGYITKPFGPETLMKAVETYIPN